MYIENSHNRGMKQRTKSDASSRRIFKNGKSNIVIGFLATSSLNTDGFSLNKIPNREVVYMGRNRKNITIQLNRRIDELLRIGEKKVKVGGRVSGIHSLRTASSYRGTAKRIAEVCKAEGVRNVEDIDTSVVERYMESYRTASAWTVSRELSAINKIL